MTVHEYLSNTMINSVLGGQYSMLDNQTAFCSYPQVHDYHEISLTTHGSMQVAIGSHTTTVKSGDLMWIRPGEVHTKSGFKDCTQLNLSFTQETVDALTAYFDNDVVSGLLTRLELMPVLTLSVSQQAEIRQRLDKLNMLSTSDLSQARMQMRILLSLVLGLFAQHVWDSEEPDQDDDPPMWFTFLLWDLGHPEKFRTTLDDISLKAQRSKAYISRSFRKYLGMTPTQYLNKLRLEYAENLLVTTNKDIVDIAMESGFDNLSHFYHQFKNKNGVPPLLYRRNHML